jgi:hypothetical protein
MKPLLRAGQRRRADAGQLIAFLTMLQKNLLGETDATGHDSRHR